MDDHLSLAASLAQAASEIHAPRSLTETLDAIAQAARQAVPGFDQAGVSVKRRDGRIETIAATDQLVWELDDAQYTAEQGPCVDAIRGCEVVTLDHPRSDDRWPDYLPVALERGVRAQLGVCLQVDGESLGGLNLYSFSARGVDRDAVHIAQLFATHAALALGWVRHDEQLNEALATRKVIGQAIGIIMERYRIDEDRAFHFLIRASSTSNIKLRDVAQELVDGANVRAAGEQRSATHGS